MVNQSLHNDLHHRDTKTMCQNREECLNGHSHILQMLIGASSETIPVSGGKLLLGRWQRILLIELDSRRRREVGITIMGEQGDTEGPFKTVDEVFDSLDS